MAGTADPFLPGVSNADLDFLLQHAGEGDDLADLDAALFPEGECLPGPLPGN
eukprot:CAMPEP_0198435830 /NCGR_PEP_ID=MMETSP1452-20131203/39772_1 /TAXON_ID=1181717 /ORGANISM="Synchroma pusillum, Strain CCMP3072" /LENGTH=51 /DNA_ID=CAMNT_0044156369 /DNA_START=46 /DNA_END=198 /DNA_ORIENTATION=+